MTGGSSVTPVARRGRGLFLAYACVLAVLTHWPQLRLPAGEIPRPDLPVHMTAFGLWTYLCVRAAWFGARTAPRNIVLAALVSIAYAALDEGTQAIPAIQRTCRWDDFAANLLGIGAGLGVGALLAAIDDERSEPTHGLH